MAEGSKPESRVFPVAAIVALIALILTMPARYTLGNVSFPYLLGTGLALPMIAAGLAPVGSIWARVERWTTVFFLCGGFIIQTILLRDLVSDIIFHTHEMSALTLLSTSVAVWMSNVLAFSILYWMMDRGGPDGRVRGWTGRTDFSFAGGNPEDRKPEQWQPSFADYLFLGFTTSTAFSPTDTLPMTKRAKMLMLAQSTVSLVTIIIVAARAINILK